MAAKLKLSSTHLSITGICRVVKTAKLSGKIKRGNENHEDLSSYSCEFMELEGDGLLVFNEGWSK